MISEVINNIPKKKPKLRIVDSFINNTINKGLGAGGCNTNKNGLPYEEMTDLKDKYNILSKEKTHNIITFNGNNKQYKTCKQSSVFKCMNEHIDKTILKAHGCKNPDECFIDDNDKIIFIIEKKFQNVGGSVCEKIQTPDFKIWQYSRTFPTYKIAYIYCLSDWFNTNCKAELEYLKYKKIPIFWGNSITYKDDIIDFIINYK
jgi:hypothetical protein